MTPSLISLSRDSGGFLFYRTNRFQSPQTEQRPRKWESPDDITTSSRIERVSTLPYKRRGQLREEPKILKITSCNKQKRDADKQLSQFNGHFPAVSVARRQTDVRNKHVYCPKQLVMQQMCRNRTLTCDCHYLQLEGEPVQHMERYGQQRAHDKHPGESLFTSGKLFDQHAASALQVNAVKMGYLNETCICNRRNSQTLTHSGRFTPDSENTSHQKRPAE